jgi:predicted dehydrogenase
MHIGVLGLGVAGAHHLESFGKIPGVEITACDIDPSRREHAATRGVHVVATLNDLLQRAPDGVVVAVPHSDLAAAARSVLDAGCHVLLEKPMATRLEDAVQLVAQARARNRWIMMSFVHRFRPEVSAARDLILGGEIGRPTMLVDSMTSGASEMPAWVWDRARAGGGMMFYNGIHQVDRARFLLGDEADRVRAEVHTLAHDVNTEDTVGALLGFRHGAMGVIVQHKAPSDALRNWETQVFGTKGSLVIRTGHEVRWAAGGKVSSRPGNPEDRFHSAAIEFVTALRERRPPSPSGEDGLEALKVVLAMYSDRAEDRPRGAFSGAE